MEMVGGAIGFVCIGFFFGGGGGGGGGGGLEGGFINSLNFIFTL